MVVGDLAVSVDVVVLGAGPGGYVSAIRAAQLGKDVVIVDPGPVGGVCLNYGCIPTKSLLTAADRAWKAKNSAAIGVEVAHVSVNLPQMQTWTDVEGKYGAKRYAFEQCVVAVGGHSAPLPGLPFDGERVLTPQQAYRVQQLPDNVAIIGVDYIAVELATFFGKLGVPVRLLLPNATPMLPAFDPSVGRHLRTNLKKLGVCIEAKITDPVEAVQDAALVVVSNGIMPNTTDLHLDAVKIATDETGFIAVDDHMRTSNPNIFAVGDVTGLSTMANEAMKQAKVAAATLAGKTTQYAPQAVPKVAWTEPEIAAVGLTAAEAEAAGYTVDAGHFPMAANGRALMLNGGTGFVSTVAEQKSGVLLGVTMMGPHAAELIGEAALALEMGATLTDLAETLHLHPSVSEPLQESAEDALGVVVHILHKK